jgi:AraC-like DNA-binding protein
MEIINSLENECHLYDRECHLVCPLYEKKDSPLVKILNRPAAFIAERKASKIEMAFLLRGEISLSCGFADKKKVEAGGIFILPKGVNYSIRYLEDSQIFIFSVDDDNELCRRLRNNLYKFCDGSEILYEGKTLKINASIRAIIDSFSKNAGLGMKCTIYINTVIDQLLLMICAYNSQDDVVAFFLPVFSKDTLFRMAVMKHRNRVFNVYELCSLCNMTYETFYRRFTEVFGVSPKAWITEERKKRILAELTGTERDFNDVSDDCGFATAEQFFKFCRKEFGKTPGMIRKGEAKNE